MKKKRIVSFILSALLVMSSLPLTPITAAQSISAAASAEIKIGTDGWLANGEEPLEVVPQTINGDVPTSYRRIADYKVQGWYTVQFWAGNWSFTAGNTYRMTLWLRRAQDVTYTGDDLSGIYVSLATNQRTTWSLSGNGSNSFTTIINEGDADFAQNTDKMLTLTDEWCKYTVDFTMTSTLTTQNRGICFINATYNQPGFDIGGFSLGLVDTATGKQTNELIPDDFLTSDRYFNDLSDTARFGALIETRSDVASMRAPAVSENTVITYAPSGETILTPGVEQRLRTWRGSNVAVHTIETDAAFAANAFSQGADKIYFYNYFLGVHDVFTEENKMTTDSIFYRVGDLTGYWNAITSVGSYDKVMTMNRRHLITYNDIAPAWRTTNQVLPTSIKDSEFTTFRIAVGDVSEGSKLTIKIAADSPSKAHENPPTVYVNSQLCTFVGSEACEAVSNGNVTATFTNHKLLCYEIPASAYDGVYMLAEIQAAEDRSFYCDHIEVYVQAHN